MVFLISRFQIIGTLSKLTQQIQPPHLMHHLPEQISAFDRQIGKIYVFLAVLSMHGRRAAVHAGCPSGPGHQGLSGVSPALPRRGEPGGRAKQGARRIRPRWDLRGEREVPASPRASPPASAAVCCGAAGRSPKRGFRHLRLGAERDPHPAGGPGQPGQQNPIGGEFLPPGVSLKSARSEKHQALSFLPFLPSFLSFFSFSLFLLLFLPFHIFSPSFQLFFSFSYFYY